MMGMLKFFLGLQIKKIDEGIFIYQQKYIRELLQKFGMNNCKPIPTPMYPFVSLSKDESRKLVDKTIYKGMIGSLLYLTARKLDILFNICLYAKFQSNLRESYLKDIKQIFRYLVDFTNLCLFYERNNNFRLEGLYDVDYAGDRTEFLGSYLISRAIKKQNSIALSTIETKYISVARCCSQFLWVNYQLEDYSSLENNILVFYDNISAINLSKNSIQHSKANHNEIRYHFIHDYVQKGIFDIKFIDTNHQWTNIFTNFLAKEHFKFITNHLHLKYMSD
uniref:Retrovirus-related Pol polyprotein from transposon TNT 1-94 n=1 Tax=Cajanus cajan TaxID=3821 RepID=A0A151T4P6_CAJCA|nr:Retrovirus-related Pol polyprotein from transposon TNT 1-94 [Cajanus cajan]